MPAVRRRGPGGRLVAALDVDAALGRYPPSPGVSTEFDRRAAAGPNAPRFCPACGRDRESAEENVSLA